CELLDVLVIVFFFKQKTAYEMIWCWSSDVCSSDLPERVAELHAWRKPDLTLDPYVALHGDVPSLPARHGVHRHRVARNHRHGRQIGRASCRERVKNAWGGLG